MTMGLGKEKKAQDVTARHKRQFVYDGLITAVQQNRPIFTA